jgi:hypothetical protein
MLNRALMAALGQKRTNAPQKVMSALPRTGVAIDTLSCVEAGRRGAAHLHRAVQYGVLSSAVHIDGNTQSQKPVLAFPHNMMGDQLRPRRSAILDYPQSSASMLRIVGRCRAISPQLSPSSRLANTEPLLVPK